MSVINIENIKAFIYLYRSGSFQKAASELYITQPSLTSRIKSLEKELEAQLFVRSRKGVELTEKGQIFLPYAFRILDAYTHGREAVRKKSDVLCIGSSSYSLLLNNMLDFLKKDRQLTLNVRTGPTPALLEYLLDGEIDCAISQYIDHPDISQSFLFDEPISLFSSLKHPFAIRKKAVTLEELSLEPLVVYDGKSNFWSEIERHFDRKGLTLYRMVEIDSLAASKSVIMQGNALAFLPELPLEADVASGKLYRVPTIPPIQVKRENYLSFRKDIAPEKMGYVTLLSEYFADH